MITVIVIAVWSDRVQMRSRFIIGSYCVESLGFVALLAIPHPAYPGLTYGMLFPAAMGIYAPLIPTLAWTGKSLRHSLQAVRPTNLNTSSKQPRTILQTRRWHGSPHFSRKLGRHCWL
jgi:hypothetical protein